MQSLIYVCHNRTTVFHQQRATIILAHKNFCINLFIKLGLASNKEFYPDYRIEEKQHLRFFIKVTINTVKDEMNTLKDEMSEIKNLLKQIISGNKENNTDAS